MHVLSINSITGWFYEPRLGLAEFGWLVYILSGLVGRRGVAVESGFAPISGSRLFVGWVARKLGNPPLISQQVSRELFTSQQDSKGEEGDESHMPYFLGRSKSPNQTGQGVLQSRATPLMWSTESQPPNRKKKKNPDQIQGKETRSHLLIREAGNSRFKG